MRLVKVVLAPVTAPELVAPDRCRVPLSQRPLFLPTFYTLRVSDDDPQLGCQVPERSWGSVGLQLVHAV